MKATATRAEGAATITAEERLSLLEQILEERDLSDKAEKVAVDRLSRSDEGIAQLERRTQMLQTLYLAGLKATRPADWVISADKAGVATAMLMGPGAARVADVYGIQVTNIRPMEGERFRPEHEPLPHGNHYVLRAWCDARSKVTEREIHGLQAARRSDEEFTGRSVTAEGALTTNPSEKAAANPTDLESAVYTLLQTKAVRVLASMTRVPVGDLERAWVGTPHKVSDCRKGHGFGTGNDRRTVKVAEEDVPAEVVKLKAEVTRITGGDVSMMKKVTKEITSGPNFAGFDSLDRLSKPFQVEQAWKHLKAHPLFGPSSASSEAGQEG